MIYQTPESNEPIDQGDLIDGCSLATVVGDQPGEPDSARVELDVRRVVVLTQTCDLANDKTEVVIVAPAFDAQELVDQNILKPAEIKGPVRSGRVWGWYFLPANSALGLGEMIVDLRQLHSVRLDFLSALCRAGRRRARIAPLYREHLAKHFADTYSRIGLPQPYETL